MQFHTLNSVLCGEADWDLVCRTLPACTEVSAGVTFLASAFLATLLLSLILLAKLFSELVRFVICCSCVVTMGLICSGCKGGNSACLQITKTIIIAKITTLMQIPAYYLTI